LLGEIKTENLGRMRRIRVAREEAIEKIKNIK
jgi:hypothetical protein